MHVTPNVERLKRLRLDGYALQTQIAFCPSCDFQYAPQTAGKNACPTCGCDLHVTTMSEELQALCRAEKRCACVWATDRLNYGASFDLDLETNTWTCGSCGGAIEPNAMPQDMRDDATLLTASPDAYRAKYAIHPKL